MPNIVFASNNIGHFPTTVAGSVPGTFDPTRVPYAITLSNYEVVSSPAFTPVTGEETWFHFRLFADGDSSFSRTDTLFQAYDENNHLLCRLSKLTSVTNYTVKLDLFDGTNTLSRTCNVPLTNGKVGFMDIRYRVTSLLIEIDVYINGLLTASQNFGANPAGYGNPNRFSLGCAFGTNLTDTMHFSEIIVADGDTRNSRLNILRPAGDGGLDDWDGPLVDLADDDMTSGMTTLDADARHTMLLTAYTGARNISNYVAVSSTTRGATAPTGLKHSIRVSGVNYDSDLIPVGQALQYNITDFPINPATSIPWDSADLIDLESGFVSVA